MDPNYSLEETVSLDLEEYPVNEEEVEFFGPDRAAEVGAPILSLEDALDIAVHHNRRYKNEKESLYLEALSLTLSRHRFAPISSSGRQKPSVIPASSPIVNSAPFMNASRQKTPIPRSAQAAKTFRSGPSFAKL